MGERAAGTWGLLDVKVTSSDDASLWFRSRLQLQFADAPYLLVFSKPHQAVHELLHCLLSILPESLSENMSGREETPEHEIIPLCHQNIGCWFSF